MKKKFALVLVIVLALTILTSVLVACSSVTITFNTNGGSEVASVKKTVQDKPTTTKAGYTFDGWYDNADFSGNEISFPYTPKESVTLFAKWSEVDSVKGVIGKLVEKMTEQINFGSANNLVWDFELDAFSTTGGDVKTTTTYRLSTKANISADNADAAAIGFALEEIIGNEVKTIFSIVVDNSNIYMEANGGEFQRNFKGFELGEVLKVKHIPDYTSYIDMAFTVLMGYLFQDVTESANGDVILTGTADEFLKELPGILELLSAVPGLESIDLASIVGALGLEQAIGGTVFTATANLNDYKGVNITAVKDGSYDAGIELRKAEFAAKETALVVPVKQELKDLPAINIVNFTLEGRFSLVNQRADFTTERTTFDYELRTDLNPFSVMEIQEDGSVKANIANLFSEGMFWFDVSHDCRTHGGNTSNSFCASRQHATGATGSILTIAFDPATFGNNSLNLSLNPNYILYKNFFNDLVGMDLSTAFGDYVGLTLDPEAIMTLFDTAAAKETYASESADITVMSILPTLIELLSNLDYSKNYIELVGDILDMVSGIKIDDNGLNLDNFDSLFAILDNFVDLDINGMSLATLLSNMFTQDVNEIELSVDNIEFADLDNLTFEAGAKYVFTNDYDGELKDYGQYTPAVNSEWQMRKDVNGEEILSLGGGNIAVVDEISGATLPISADELDTLLTDGSINYNAIMPDGSVKAASTQILDVIEGPERDENGKILPGRHKVKLLTGMTDGGALSGLLTLVSQMGPALGLNIDLTIPGNIVEGYITVTDTVGDAKWYQEEQYNSVNFDPNKTYVYGDKLNPYFNAELTYNYKQTGAADNFKKSFQVRPYSKELDRDVLGIMFSNYGNINNSELVAFGTTNVVYQAFGTEHNIIVKMAESYMTKMNGNTDAMMFEGKADDAVIPVSLDVDQTYTFANSGNYSFNYKVSESVKEQGGYPRKAFVFNKLEGMEVTDVDAIKFTKKGEYTLSGTANGAPFQMKFLVGGLNVIETPKYNMSISGLNADGYIPVSFTRANNILDGNGVDVKFNIKFNNGANLAADKFDVYVKNGNEYVKANSIFLKQNIAPYNPQVYFVKLADGVEYKPYEDTIKVTATATATEYANGIAAEKEFNYGINIANTGLVTLNEVNGLRIRLLANVELSNVTVEVKVGDSVVTNVKWLKVLGMEFWGSFSEVQYVDATNYVPSFNPIAAYDEFTTAGSYKTSVLPWAITWDGLTEETQYTITVKAADGTVVATVTNIA